MVAQVDRRTTATKLSSPYRDAQPTTIVGWAPVVIAGEVRIHGTTHEGLRLTSAVLNCFGKPLQVPYTEDFDLFDEGMVVRTWTGSRYRLGSRTGA